MGQCYPSKKLRSITQEDFTVDLTPAVNCSTSMQNDQIALHCPRSPLPDPKPFQFFVRLLSESKSLVVCASSMDKIVSIHEKIQLSIGMPVCYQRLVYGGKQLYWEQTLYQCGIQKDATLHLMSRLPSTAHPKASALIKDLLSLIFSTYKSKQLVLNPALKTIRSMLLEFLSMTPHADSQKATGHLQIFTDSSIPQALVMLYMSFHKNIRDVADDAIRSFFGSSKTLLQKDIYHLCGPIALEFCKFLSKAAGTKDPLYVLCRSSLGSMVENTDVQQNKTLLGLKDIFPFVKELAIELSNYLVGTKESIPIVGPLSVVIDFSAFLVPVRKEIERCGPIEFPPGGEYFYSDYFGEIISLHEVFADLLFKMGKCLMKIEEHLDNANKQDDKNLSYGCCHYLAILKELNLVSKLYRGSEKVFWETMKQRTVGLGYLIVKYVKRLEGYYWILDEGKEATNFEARRHLALMMFPELKFEYAVEMLIDRSNLLKESFNYVIQADSRYLRSGLVMKFTNEKATGPGVLREWFFLVCQEIFNPQNALFVPCPNDRRRFFPNPASKVDPLHLEYFTFSGRMIALALMHKVQVGIVFDRVFFLQLAGHSISLEDIQDADPYFYRSCKQILDMDPQAIDQDVLGLTFIHEIDELGARKVVELCPGGKSVIVNSKNRKQYVESLIQHRFVTSIGEQIKHFVQGFADIVNSHKLRRSFFLCLEPKDLDWMLHGSDNAISVDDWEAHTEYCGFNKKDSQISWFWKTVRDMTAEQKKVLLFFWTSIKYLPVEGFGGLASRLYIHKTSGSSARLPSSHTCFYQLCFPSYPSLSVTRDRLRIITQEHIGCSFGTW